MAANKFRRCIFIWRGLVGAQAPCRHGIFTISYRSNKVSVLVFVFAGSFATSCLAGRGGPSRPLRRGQREAFSAVATGGRVASGAGFSRRWLLVGRQLKAAEGVKTREALKTKAVPTKNSFIVNSVVSCHGSAGMRLFKAATEAVLTPNQKQNTGAYDKNPFQPTQFFMSANEPRAISSVLFRGCMVGAF